MGSMEPLFHMEPAPFLHAKFFYAPLFVLPITCIWYLEWNPSFENPGSATDTSVHVAFYQHGTLCLVICSAPPYST